jgi:hypothetical protein
MEQSLFDKIAPQAKLLVVILLDPIKEISKLINFPGVAQDRSINGSFSDLESIDS